MKTEEPSSNFISLCLDETQTDDSLACCHGYFDVLSYATFLHEKEQFKVFVLLHGNATIHSSSEVS